MNYREVDFAEAVREVYPDGIDVIEDFVGPAYFRRHISLLRWKGRLTFVGLLSSGVAEIDVASVLTKMLRLYGFTLRPHSTEEKARVVERFRIRWLPYLIRGDIQQEIYAVLPFEQAIEAHRILDAAENFGKIILKA